MPTPPIRVILAEDHVLVRKGLVALLERMADVEVVGEAGDGRSALRIIRELQPDLALMDISMPNLNGLDATARSVAQTPGTRVIIVSMHASRRHVIDAMRAGASGYLLKHCETAEFERAIRTVAGGGKYLTPEISSAVIEMFVGAGELESLDCPLTPRQREILQLVAEGHSSREIGRLLNLSPKTIEAHRAEIMARLDIHDVTGLVRYAIGIGLISPDP